MAVGVVDGLEVRPTCRCVDANADSMWYDSGASPLLGLDSFSTSCAARPVDWCVTDGCSASSWFSRKIFQFECWMTRKQLGTTSTSPSGARSHMSSKAMLRFARGTPSASGRRRPGWRRRSRGSSRRAPPASCCSRGCRAPSACPRSPLHHRDVSQPAVVVEGPGVVRAAEELAGVAVAVAARSCCRGAGSGCRARARCRPAAHHEHRLAADLHRVVVARLLGTCDSWPQ